MSAHSFLYSAFCTSGRGREFFSPCRSIRYAPELHRNFLFTVQYLDPLPFCIGSNFFERSHSSPVRNFRGSGFHSTFLEGFSCAGSWEITLWCNQNRQFTEQCNRLGFLHVVQVTVKFDWVPCMCMIRGLDCCLTPSLESWGDSGTEG